MKSVANDHIRKARQCLVDGRKILEIDLVYEAGRSAYVAAFHAALAYIIFKTGKNVKTHSGVRSEFGRLAKDEPNIDRVFTAFLAQSYNLKVVADYGVGVESTFSIAEAESALETAEKFVNCLDIIIQGRNSR